MSPMRLFLSRAVFGALTATLAPATLSAPTAQVKPAAVNDRPAFEAASVKADKSIDARSYSTLTRPGSHVAIYSETLRQLIAQAYGFSHLSQATYGIAGMPRWADSERFDIDAESPGNPSIDQKRLMLQSLLADRFKFVVRHETRQMPLYALVTAKAGQLGPQLRPRADDAACQQLSSAQAAASSTGLPPAEAAKLALQQFPCGRIAGGVLKDAGPNPIWSGGRKVTLAAIADSLGGDEYIDRPVIDRTGLSGNFDFTIEWNTNQQDLHVNPQPDTEGLSLFEAVRTQLGLKVQSEQGPVSVMVIEHVERPAEN